MRINWKEPISAIGTGVSELIKLAETYWIHVGAGIVLLIFIILFLVVRNG